MDKPLVILVTPSPLSNRTSEENLGLGYLASSLRKKDIEVVIIDGWMEDLSPEQIVERILEQRKPLFVGFSCYQLNKALTVEVLKGLKARNYDVPFATGGFGPTFNPEDFLQSGFDVVMRSEGEDSIVKLSEHYMYSKPALSEIPGVCYIDEKGAFCQKKLQLISNLDEIPFPSRETVQIAIKNKTLVNILTSRGCMGNCLFCSVAAFWRTADGAVWRQRSMLNIVDEMEYLYSLGARHLKFVDDSFIEPPRDREWCKAFADEVIRRGLKFNIRIAIRADRVDEDIIYELSRAGCNSAAIGIENFSDTALNRMGKKADVAQNKKALDILKKYNWYVQAGFILFDYGTTLEELRLSYEKMCEYSWTITKGIFLEMYAGIGTPYSELLKKKGLVNSEKTYLQNYSYDIIDLEVRKVYKALKAWHVNHMKTYDMIIDPISKPKAIEEFEYKKFYDLYMEVRMKDLDFMKQILDLVENGITDDELDTYVAKAIEKESEWYNQIGIRCQEMYESENIKYRAVKNPFYPQ